MTSWRLGFVWAVRRGLAVAAFLLVVAPVALPAQERPTTRPAAAESVMVVAGAGYGASWLRGTMAGRGYRELWVSPVRVEVADLSRLGGGITPMRLGGG